MGFGIPLAQLDQFPIVIYLLLEGIEPGKNTAFPAGLLLPAQLLVHPG